MHIIFQFATAALILLIASVIEAPDAEAEAAPLVRFAVLGDAEPKPEPEFPGLEAAVSDVNALSARDRIDFVVGVGDIAHKGTIVQYENATRALERLRAPFYPIMGNEELNASLERYLDYAGRWNDEVDSPRYVRDLGPIVMVHASPDSGRDFADEGIDWMRRQVEAAAPKPVFLVVHAAEAGTFPENPDKGVHNARFGDVMDLSNLAVVISGDLHMDMDRTGHSKQVDGVHHLHSPALERTKIPDETRHTPMYRVVTVMPDGSVAVDTYETGTSTPLERHDYDFTLDLP